MKTREEFINMSDEDAARYLKALAPEEEAYDMAYISGCFEDRRALKEALEYLYDHHCDFSHLREDGDRGLETANEWNKWNEFLDEIEEKYDLYDD